MSIHVNTFEDAHDYDFVKLMTGNIIHWREQQGGAVTPITGIPKTVPWYLLVLCDKEHITVTNSKRAMGMRFRCNRTGWRPGTGSIQCESKVEIIEVPDMEEQFGLSVEAADRIHGMWMKENQ